MERLIIYSHWKHPSIAGLFEPVTQLLRERYQIQSFYSPELDSKWMKPGTLLYTYNNQSCEWFARRAAEGVKVWGGKDLNRSAQLRLVESFGLSTIPWCPTPCPLTEAHQLFDKWQTDFILSKESGTWGGKSVKLLRRECIRPEMVERDGILCQVTPDPQLYKIEFIGKQQTLCWTAVPKSVLRDDYPEYEKLFNPEKLMWDPPDSLLSQVNELGAYLLEHSFVLVSLDLMQFDGKLCVIEMNMNEVGLWWSYQLPGQAGRVAKALSCAWDDSFRFEKL